ncbi:class 3 adenylate cyclase [Paenarthrobacter nicotinovorans]|uniref:adenylate/guanylate cyclase domain-containing protein n=1 Tax=Paenarthrobacter nicotinovorans TaxID=29320 RepID=UPI00278B9459|nr:adenylate/guanylate cyclase domain-containing protein [Paenarthrobacter nicotinovorans]MDP9936913.1 class 3 adenylate cyclase [Paenarthrobacter nicotinovorans]
MNNYTAGMFGDTVMSDFSIRRASNGVVKESLRASAGLESKALGHPAYEDLRVGERLTSPMVMVFIDLTDFTGRSFWDDETEVADLAHALLTGFVQTVTAFGGFPLGLRGDGLFAGFGPGNAQVDSVMALSACAFALDAVQKEVNPRLQVRNIQPVQARAGLDYGRITFVRSGSQEHSEVNPLGFAANFAAKCEKQANSWEIVIGQGIAEQLPDSSTFSRHEKSPKSYQRAGLVKTYNFYQYHWRKTLQHIPGTVQQINGKSTASITIN